MLLQKLVEVIKSEHPLAFRIGSYAAMPHEPDLSLLHALLPNVQFHYPLVKNEQEMEFYHVSDPDTLARGRFGILEPSPRHHPPVQEADLDLILVPGLAFDLQGYRLGQGAGYYDRFLSKVPLVPRIGVSFSSQHLPTLPSEPHDIAMGSLVSERGFQRVS